MLTLTLTQCAVNYSKQATGHRRPFLGPNFGGLGRRGSGRSHLAVHGLAP
jgi:hypothetical protein